MNNASTSQGSYSIRSVVRAAHILELLKGIDKGSSLGELSKRSELAKSSVFRLLRTLEEVGLVDYDPSSEAYKLGVKCLELGHAYLERTDLRSVARPVMERLRTEFNETVHLGVLDGDLRVVYIEKFETKHAVGLMMSRVGKTSPCYCTGIGKAAMAALPGDPVGSLIERGPLHRYTAATKCNPEELREELAAIRVRGVSFDLEEHEPGVRCVASPVEGRGDVTAAISVAGPTHRLPDHLLEGKLSEAIREAAEEISRGLRVGRR